ncbi:unnamed protein product [Phytophthora lilii]|uniref:Unnamed protein product n=1 Tax=Phytophthora lilii TaxID=2077276 RepID=A0A9W6WM24_9STRA|nr:unnamed protein product [Phytophthora lilii]
MKSGSAPKPVEIEAQIEDVEREHRDSFQANLLNGADSAVLMNESCGTSFNEDYDALQRTAAPSSLTNLQQVCCGLATVFANTASVKSDFSTLKWELEQPGQQQLRTLCTIKVLTCKHIILTTGVSRAICTSTTFGSGGSSSDFYLRREAACYKLQGRPEAVLRRASDE